MTGALIGLAAGCGAVLVLLALAGPAPVDRGRSHRAQSARWWPARLGSVLPVLVAGCLASVIGLAVTAVPAIALVAAVAGGAVPVLVRRRRQEALRRSVRQAWPDAIDTLASGVRAGLSLPGAVAAVGTSGPEPLRPVFSAFAIEHRVSGSFAAGIAAMTRAGAEQGPSGTVDRVTAALTVAAEVGGADLGLVLRSLSQMLREEARVRSEIEARQSWTVSAARLAVAAPFVTALLLSIRPEGARAYATPGGTVVLACAAVLSLIAYQLMRRIARLPDDGRSLA